MGFCLFVFFFFNDTATTEIYTVMNTLSLHDALPISSPPCAHCRSRGSCWTARRSEEHTSELQSLITISYAVFCLKKKKNKDLPQQTTKHPQHIKKQTQDKQN